MQLCATVSQRKALPPESVFLVDKPGTFRTCALQVTIMIRNRRHGQEELFTILESHLEVGVKTSGNEVNNLLESAKFDVYFVVYTSVP